MLTKEQRDAFEQRGHFRISGAFSQDEAKAMEALLWQTLNEKYGANPDDKGTWDFGHITGLQTIHAHPVFDPIGSSATQDGINKILGNGTWKTPSHWGQFLITFPAQTHWNIPTAWHTDFGFTTPVREISGVVVFSYMADVLPRGGGTVVLEGSHRLMQAFVKKQSPRFLKKMKNVRKAFLESDPWLHQMSMESDDPERIKKYMADGHMINDIPLTVVELTGQAGDIVITHPWLLHSPAVNSGDWPRFMRIQRIHLSEKE